VHKYFAFSLHKAGSTLFYTLLRYAAHASQKVNCGKRMAYISIPEKLVRSGVPEAVLFDENFTSPVDLDQKDTIYGGFHFVPGMLNEQILSNAGVMMLVRDPRDILTSLYYSVAISHRLPHGEAGREMKAFRDSILNTAIDDFVLKQARMATWVERLDRLSGMKDRGKTWRYEDVIFDKARWLDEMLAYLNLDVPRGRRRHIIQREDVVPTADRPGQHVRQVTPGDHRRKLKPETIDELNSLFKKFINLWNY